LKEALYRRVTAILPSVSSDISGLNEVIVFAARKERWFANSSGRSVKAMDMTKVWHGILG